MLCTASFLKSAIAVLAEPPPILSNCLPKSWRTGLRTGGHGSLRPPLQTGERIPAALIEKIHKAEKFNQGFKTVEYLAASLLDLEWHTLASAAEPNAQTLENVALARMAIPQQIVPRYRSTYFQHIFAGGYSAGYYSYIWAEVLDADAFQAFKEKGIFDPTTATSFRMNILEKGYSEEPMTLYQRFRGRSPSVEPLLEKRGLKGT